MSVNGKWATHLHGEVRDGDLMHRLMSPGRKTLSVARARLREGGVAGLMSRLDIRTANALQRLMSERFVLLAKLRALEERTEAEPSQTTEHTDDLMRIRTAVADSAAELRALAREDTPALLALFDDPSVAHAMQLSSGSEEEAFMHAYETFGSVDVARDKARLWRHSVGSVGHRVAGAAQYRYTTHNSPNHKGDRALSNILGAATAEENLSYYEAQTLKHGRARRGSSSIHGAWKDVWDESGEFVQGSEQPVPVLPGLGLGGGGGSGGSVAGSHYTRERSPSAQPRAAASARAASGQGASLLAAASANAPTSHTAATSTYFGAGTEQQQQQQRTDALRAQLAQLSLLKRQAQSAVRERSSSPSRARPAAAVAEFASEYGAPYAGAAARVAAAQAAAAAALPRQLQGAALQMQGGALQASELAMAQSAAFLGRGSGRG